MFLASACLKEAFQRLWLLAHTIERVGLATMHPLSTRGILD